MAHLFLSLSLSFSLSSPTHVQWGVKVCGRESGSKQGDKSSGPITSALIVLQQNHRKREEKKQRGGGIIRLMRIDIMGGSEIKWEISLHHLYFIYCIWQILALLKIKVLKGGFRNDAIREPFWVPQQVSQ